MALLMGLCGGDLWISWLYGSGTKPWQRWHFRHSQTQLSFTSDPKSVVWEERSALLKRCAEVVLGPLSVRVRFQTAAGVAFWALPDAAVIRVRHPHSHPQTEENEGNQTPHPHWHPQTEESGGHQASLVPGAGAGRIHFSAAPTTLLALKRMTAASGNAKNATRATAWYLQTHTHSPVEVPKVPPLPHFWKSLVPFVFSVAGAKWGERIWLQIGFLNFPGLRVPVKVNELVPFVFLGCRCE